MDEQLMFGVVCVFRELHLSDDWRRAAGTAAASQESEEEGKNTSRSLFLFSLRVIT